MPTADNISADVANNFSANAFNPATASDRFAHGYSSSVPLSVETTAGQMNTKQQIEADAYGQATWAERAAALLDSEAPFQVVSYQRSKIRVTTGRRDCNIKAAPRRVTCFVGRLDIDTTENELADYLTEVGISNVKCIKLKPKAGMKFYTAAFKVSCDVSSKDIFYDESVWPAGAELRDWIFHHKDGVINNGPTN